MRRLGLFRRILEPKPTRYGRDKYGPIPGCEYLRDTKTKFRQRFGYIGRRRWW